MEQVEKADKVEKVEKVEKAEKAVFVYLKARAWSSGRAYKTLKTIASGCSEFHALLTAQRFPKG